MTKHFNLRFKYFIRWVFKLILLTASQQGDVHPVAWLVVDGQVKLLGLQ